MRNERPPHAEASLHELLPWYVAGTLDAGEADAFREHLDGCTACRDDMKFLGALRAELARHGEEFLADHPAPDELFSFERGELAGDAAQRVGRHLALCATCGAEMGWISGRSVAQAHEVEPIRVRPRRSWIPWTVAVVAGLAGFLLAPFWRPIARDSGPLAATYLAGPQRAGAEREIVEVRPGQRRFLLVVDADLGQDAFPARLEIRDYAGRTVREGQVTADFMYRGTFLFVDCDRREFPDGAYLLRLEPAGAPAIDYPFQVSGVDPSEPTPRPNDNR